jgi:hypothetical protein
MASKLQIHQQKSNRNVICLPYVENLGKQTCLAAFVEMYIAILKVYIYCLGDEVRKILKIRKIGGGKYD